MTPPHLAEHFFRHEYAKLVAVLTRRVGAQHIETVEDAVQSALVKALDNWSHAGTPENPPAWLYQVARNNLIGDLRQQSNRRQLLDQNTRDLRYDDAPGDAPEYLLPGEVQDGLLRMLFVCCDDAIPQPSQLVLALKTLCGFSVGEIALRLFTSEANVYQRLSRGRKRLREDSLGLEDLSPEQVSSRLSPVHTILYVLFTEGYLSSHENTAIRRELCDEAIRLATILVEHPSGQVPETFALLALMHLHLARMSARQDGAGGLLLLEEQDRLLWDQERIQQGMGWLSQSAKGNVFSRYHAEAGIAAEHCLAPSFHETRWDRVVDNYALLERIAPSPVHQLNRAVAVAEWKGPQAGLAVLKDAELPAWLSGSYLSTAVLADLNQRCGNIRAAKHYRKEAIQSAPTLAIRMLLEKRLSS